MVVAYHKVLVCYFKRCVLTLLNAFLNMVVHTTVDPCVQYLYSTLEAFVLSTS